MTEKAAFNAEEWSKVVEAPALAALTVIAAEASYSYTPLFGIMFDAAVPLYRSNFYLPRFGGTIALKP